jgi:hypothetical protein
MKATTWIGIPRAIYRNAMDGISYGFRLTHGLALVVGLWLLFLILRSMIRIALMNRHYQDFFAVITGTAVYKAVALRLRGNRDPEAIHAILLWLFPAYMLLLIIVYFLGAMLAFAVLYWGTHAVNTWHQAFLASGSALNTLGFATPTSITGQWLAIPEGALGLGIVVFLFTFIPSYQAVIRAREDRTSWLYVRAGDRPTGVALLEWCQRAGIGENMSAVWEAWEDWFRMLGDTHSVLPMLSIAPSVQSGQSWVLAAAAVLDAAALTASSIETGCAASAEVCVRTGTRAFLAIAEALGRAQSAADRGCVPPAREEYDAELARLSSAGMHARSTADRENQRNAYLAMRATYEDALSFVARRTFTTLAQRKPYQYRALTVQGRGHANDRR